AWTDLAELLFCKMLTPTVYDEHTVTLSFEKLDTQETFHSIHYGQEKYGVESSFFKIHKNEEPAFLMAYHKALINVKIQDKKRVLDLGINGADEFELIKNILDQDTYSMIDFTGIDYSASAINYAQDKFPEKNMHFIEHDINQLDELDLGKFDLIISIGTFQSPNINFKPFFMNLVQNYLNTTSAIILGFPNCRWMDGEMVYGAKVPNYAMSEMGLLYSDVIYCKKYLQQKKFRVTLTGKNYIFLTATKIHSKSSDEKVI
ncbi:methyltransferase domain-containing protein, partial [Sulfurimonas sp. MAG313]